MSEEKTTFTPEEASIHLQIDYSQFLLHWLPGYARFLSESARSTEPILTQIDLALFEKVVEFQRAGHTHRQIRAVLSKFWRPETQKALPALVAAVAAKQRAARRK